MKPRKARLTVTVDRALIEAASEAVSEGRADSLSGWVNLALAERVARERRLRALAVAISSYERRSGEITAAELTLQEREDMGSAVVIRQPPRPARRRGSG